MIAARSVHCPPDVKQTPFPGAASTPSPKESTTNRGRAVIAGVVTSVVASPVRPTPALASRTMLPDTPLCFTLNALGDWLEAPDVSTGTTKNLAGAATRTFGSDDGSAIVCTPPADSANDDSVATR